MKRIITILLVLFCITGVAVSQQVPPKPVPQRLVNDLTKTTLTPDQVQTLERKLVAYDDSTSNQIVIVIVPTLNDYAPVDYATKLGREWGVGTAKNNGVIVLISTEPNNRQIFIAPGYGLEGAIPDITAKSIIEDVILPHFRQDHYFTGLDLGTNAIIKAAAGEYKAPAGYRNRGRGSGGGGSILGAIIFFLVMIMLFSRGGRGGGGRGGGMASRRGFGDVATGMLIGSMLSGGRGGGGFGGGGFGGGSGGGFGGFGGGSFGGGGAGGSW
ncbi:TPM domain-containing protein [Aridibaculum aurantiacum]|uniref:TPM domain-containing protein n=1 Tax=Aridibaculum aurantiacum TaxID=2810307 RepID=UPI001A959EB3|nr:TPM domain-containing protein [Aridibaculum aurantiacum]